MNKTDLINNKFSSILTNNRFIDETEGIWSADIEESFLEALALYPSCGRRKIILTEEGKMYGRNELVERYIKIRTGKIRTRKQVSSHLQVLTKRRSKDLQLLRNDKQAQQIILDRLKRYTSTEIASKDINNKQIIKNKERRHVKISSSKLKTTTVKNLPHPLPIDEYSSTIKQSSTNIDSLKLSEDISINNIIADLISSHTPIIKTNTTKRLNNPISSVLPTSPVLYSHGTSCSRCLSNTSSSSPLSCDSINSTNFMITNSISSPLAIIGNETFRLYDLSAFIEIKRLPDSTNSSIIYPYSENNSIYQHNLLRLHSNDIQIKILHTFETISIDRISDKFPYQDDLKDLFEYNPNGSFFLIKFWTDMTISSSSSIMNDDESFFTSYTYTSYLNRPIHISTRLCSFGKQVLEKVEISEYPQYDQFNQFIYRFDRSLLCDYMIQFIQKLRSLPNPIMMNSVLENFTILQVIKCRDDSEQLLLCLAFVFEIAMFDGDGPQYQVYKLVAN